MLITKLAVARLADIARDGRFPDWLGLLGVAIQVTEEAEATDRVLTRTWGEQLLSLMPEYARTGAMLAGILRDGSTVLTWRHLDDTERALRDAATSGAS